MRIEIKLFLTIWLVYAVFATPAGGVTPNRYVDLVHSIVNEGRFEIDTYHENTIDKAYYNGHYYAGALPGPALLAVPAYVVFKGVYEIVPESLKEVAGNVESYQKQKQPGSSFYGAVDNVEFFFSQLFLVACVVGGISALSAVMVFSILKLLNAEDRVALWLTFCYAFGTIIFWNSTVFFEQVFTIFFVVTGFYMLFRAKRESLWSEYFIAGVFTGGALLVELSGVFAIGLISLYSVIKVRQFRKILVYAIGVSIPLVILAVYNYILFGNPLSTPYQHLVGGGYEDVMGEGFGGVTYPHIDRFVGLLFSPARGILAFSPIVILGLWGLVSRLVKRDQVTPETIFFGAMVAVYFLFVSSFRGWNAGNGFGPRYLSSGLPFMVIPAVFIFNHRNMMVGLVLGLVSIFINWAGAQYGFAPDYYQHIANLLTYGPSLPIIEAITTHHTGDSVLLNWIIAARPILASIGMMVLLGVMSWLWRESLVVCMRMRHGSK